MDRTYTMTEIEEMIRDYCKEKCEDSRHDCDDLLDYLKNRQVAKEPQA